MTEGEVQIGREDGLVVAILSGELDMDNAFALGERITGALTGADGLLVDLTAVTFFDSTAVRMLDRLVGDAQAPVRVVAPEGVPARAVLRICAFPDELLADGREAALAGLQAARRRDRPA